MQSLGAFSAYKPLQFPGSAVIMAQPLSEEE